MGNQCRDNLFFQPSSWTKVLWPMIYIGEIAVSNVAAFSGEPMIALTNAQQIWHSLWTSDNYKFDHATAFYETIV
jgi:hypothetical protein